MVNLVVSLTRYTNPGPCRQQSMPRSPRLQVDVLTSKPIYQKPSPFPDPHLRFLSQSPFPGLIWSRLQTVCTAVVLTIHRNIRSCCRGLRLRLAGYLERAAMKLSPLLCAFQVAHPQFEKPSLLLLSALAVLANQSKGPGQLLNQSLRAVGVELGVGDLNGVARRTARRRLKLVKESRGNCRFIDVKLPCPPLGAGGEQGSNLETDQSSCVLNSALRRL